MTDPAFERNVQIALQSGNIDLEDVIDLNQINNIGLANQALKFKKKKKQERDQANQQEMIRAQGEAQAQASEAAAMAEVQKREAIAQTEIQVLQSKSQFEIQRMMQELEIKKQLLAEQFQYDLELAKMQMDIANTKLNQMEDRKDQRTKIQATQQSELIEQRKNNTMPKDFENTGAAEFDLGLM